MSRLILRPIDDLCLTCGRWRDDPDASFCSDAIHKYMPVTDEDLIKQRKEREAKEAAAEEIKNNPTDDDMDDFMRLVDL